MKRIIALAVASVVAVAASAAEPVDPAKATYADIEATFGSVPTFLKVFPSVAISGAWNEMKSLQMNPHTALSGKEKELIGLAVAAPQGLVVPVIRDAQLVPLDAEVIGSRRR